MELQPNRTVETNVRETVAEGMELTDISTSALNWLRGTLARNLVPLPSGMEMQLICATLTPVVFPKQVHQSLAIL
jgi:hypothetical protein